MLQIVNRDDLKFAMKCSAALINGEWVDVFKDPITDKGKKSIAGRFSVVSEDGELKLAQFGEPDDLLCLRFMNGSLYNETTFSEVRAKNQD